MTKKSLLRIQLQNSSLLPTLYSLAHPASPQRLPGPCLQPAAPASTRFWHHCQPSARRESTLPVVGHDAFAQDNADPHKINKGLTVRNPWGLQVLHQETELKA